MPISLAALLVALRSVIRSRSDLQLENLALRHQISVLRHSSKKRPKLTSGDRVNIGTYTKDLNARAVAVTPASSAWTEFEMSHRNGAVQIIARKGDVNISEGSETVTLLQGQSATRDDSATSDNSDKSKKQKKRNAQVPAAGAQKGILDSPVWIGVGAAAIGTGLIYALTRSGSPVSPINP